MSLNGAILNPDGTPVLIVGEKLFLNQGGVLMEYESGNGYPGQGNNFYSQKGHLFLTNRRVIYVSHPPMDYFRNLNVPLENLKGGTLQQPWFQANCYQATVQPVPNGGLTLQGQVKFSFKEGGGFEFSSMFMQLRSRVTGDTLPHEEPLPLYSPTDSSSSAAPPRAGTAPVFPMPLPPAFSEPSSAPPPQASFDPQASSTTAERPPNY
ncbi:hypothetical protein DFJ77DRAFT_513323 [Powellomyces hirtus]|nr:hypothetical protein DFJ77DRAFT_513323 [Powellomyces hirtus]